MEIALSNLLQLHGDRVRKVLNLLIESPYFYAQDDNDSFIFLKRHRPEFVLVFGREQGHPQG